MSFCSLTFLYLWHLVYWRSGHFYQPRGWEKADSSVGQAVRGILLKKYRPYLEILEAESMFNIQNSGGRVIANNRTSKI